MTKGIPTHFIQLDPEVAQKAIEGYDCSLSAEQVQAEALYRQHVRCPRGCGNTMQKHAGSVAFAFSDPNWNIPRCLMRCHHCGCTVNPFDGMIVDLGKPDEANAGGLLIKTEE